MIKPQLLQIMRFGLVGLVAAMVHFTTVILLVHHFQYAPLIANIGGFMVSFQVSYWGHRMWTFSDTVISHSEAYPRLVLIQTINFCVNEYLYYYLLSLQISYQSALILVIAIMPLFTFLTSKVWVFQSKLNVR